MAVLLRVSMGTAEYGKGLCKKKAKQRETAKKVQSRRKNGFYTASTIMGANIEYYTTT
jgi:hypothetical protein